MSNVIPFRQRSAGQPTTQKQVHAPTEEAVVLDVTQRIQESTETDRRRVQRVVLNDFIAAHVYIPGRGLMRVTLKDIHEKGLAFEVDQREGQFQRGETLEMRFYMNHETYFRFDVEVMHFNHNEDEGSIRHGCQFQAGTLNDVALHHFVGFLKNISPSLRTDRGDRTVSKIYS